MPPLCYSPLQADLDLLISCALGCDTDFQPVCTHAFPEFDRFLIKIQTIFHLVGIFERLIHHVHP